MRDFLLICIFRQETFDGFLLFSHRDSDYSDHNLCGIGKQEKEQGIDPKRRTKVPVSQTAVCVTGTFLSFHRKVRPMKFKTLSVRPAICGSTPGKAVTVCSYRSDRSRR